jgi:S1-C subfamily serine protease
MLRALTIAALLAIVPAGMSGQTPSLLHIRVTLADPARISIPVPRHALLISDDPATSVPRRVVTGADGTVDVSLLPGRYTVESDQPVAFGGKAYQWTQRLVLTAGRNLVLELTAENAEAGAAPAPAEPRTLAPPEDDSLLLLPEWTNSVVAVWTPTSRASGFIIDASGLVLTNARAVGSTSAAEVQLTPGVKVAARVLAVDRTRDVAVLLIDPSVIMSVRPVSLECAAGAKPSFADGQKLVALGAPLRGPHDVSTGEVLGVERPATVADLRLAPGGTGGPVFSTSGTLVGISSIADDEDQRRGDDVRIVPVSDACEVVSAAQKARPAGKGPGAVHLPVELSLPFPPGALEAAVRSRAGSLTPYTMSSSDFDIAFLTPVIIYGAQHTAPQGGGRGGLRELEAQQRPLVNVTDFGDWSGYFEDGPPVLVVRVTPKFEEGFWTKFARGAASTQGVALPPIKRFKPGFSRLRVSCGDVEVAPIHPFVLEQRVSATDAIREGLYVFDPLALGPQCKAVALGLFSEKAPDKEDTRVVDPTMIERIWRDSVFLSVR